MVLGFAVFQIILLSKNGQTVGKYLLEIKIVRLDSGRNGGFITNVLLRGIALAMIGEIMNKVSFYLGLSLFFLDILFIFRKDRRCLHDLIAGTVVVDA